MGPPLGLPLLSSKWTRSPCRRDDDEDQHSAVLWLSFQEGGGQEAGVEGARGREALAAGVPTRSPLRECPRDRHCGSAHEIATAGVPTRPRPLPRDEEPLRQCTETGPEQLVRDQQSFVYIFTLLFLVSNCITRNIQFSNCQPVFLLCCTPTVATLEKAESTLLNCVTARRDERPGTTSTPTRSPLWERPET
jgi:hypothetical protein